VHKPHHHAKLADLGGVAAAKELKKNSAAITATSFFGRFSAAA